MPFTLPKIKGETEYVWIFKIKYNKYNKLTQV